MEHSTKSLAYRWKPGMLMLLSAAVYTLLVSRPVETLYVRPDLKGYVDEHFVVYVGIVLAGLLLGLAAQPWMELGLPRAINGLMPKAPDGKRTTYLRSAAWLVIVTSMIPTLLWTVSSLNVFIDVHRWLFVEANLLVYLMGALNGIAWSVLLPRQAWFGLWLTPAALLMVLSNVLTSHSWY